MRKPDVITLITENARTHGVHDTVTDVERTVCCTVMSVSRTEYYNALNAGIMPEYVFALALAEDYNDERTLKYNGKKYRIVRTYITDEGGIELTAERGDVNGGDAGGNLSE